MFTKSLLALSALSMVAVPAVADAHHRDGYYNQSYSQGYYPQQGYDQSYSQGYYPQQAYGYDNNYYGRSYGYRQHRCSGTTGTIVGAGAGALLGRSLGRGSGYYHQNSGTTGTILGAAIGALVGRQVGKSTC
ncbi:MAG: glycine zipper 2TM domain-containing protein [Sphingomicrobium sp.]